MHIRVKHIEFYGLIDLLSACTLISSKNIPTPNIDKIATQGVMFANANEVGQLADLVKQE